MAMAEWQSVMLSGGPLIEHVMGDHTKGVGPCWRPPPVLIRICCIPDLGDQPRTRVR